MNTPAPVNNFGFFKLSRGELQHFWSDPEMLRAYLWLKANAAYGDVDVPAISGRQRFVIRLKRGQLAHASTFIAKAWGCDEKSVRRLIGTLEQEGFLKTRKFRGRRIITLCYYDRNFDAGQSAGQTQSVTHCNDGEFLTGASESAALTADKVKNLRTDTAAAPCLSGAAEAEEEPEWLEEADSHPDGWPDEEPDFDRQEEPIPASQTPEGEESISSGRPFNNENIPPPVCPARPAPPEISAAPRSNDQAFKAYMRDLMEKSRAEAPVLTPKPQPRICRHCQSGEGVLVECELDNWGGYIRLHPACVAKCEDLTDKDEPVEAGDAVDLNGAVADATAISYNTNEMEMTDDDSGETETAEAPSGVSRSLVPEG